MKKILFLFIVLNGTFTLADNYNAPKIKESIQIIKSSRLNEIENAIESSNNNKNPTSCRLYRKRVAQFLQRVNEVTIASSVQKNKLSLKEINRILDLLQRTDIPLDLIEEKIEWNIEFEVGQYLNHINQSQLHVVIDSTYLQWETIEGLYPDHFQIQIDNNSKSIHVVYKMNYMEACLNPLLFNIKVYSDLNSIITLQSNFNSNLL